MSLISASGMTWQGHYLKPILSKKKTCSYATVVFQTYRFLSFLVALGIWYATREAEICKKSWRWTKMVFIYNKDVSMCITGIQGIHCKHLSATIVHHNTCKTQHGKALSVDYGWWSFKKQNVMFLRQVVHRKKDTLAASNINTWRKWINNLITIATLPLQSMFHRILKRVPPIRWFFQLPYAWKNIENGTKLVAFCGFSAIFRNEVQSDVLKACRTQTLTMKARSTLSRWSTMKKYPTFEHCSTSAKGSVQNFFNVKRKEGTTQSSL